MIINTKFKKFIVIILIMGQVIVPLFRNSQKVIAATVSSLSDTISDSRVNVFANHLVSFTTINAINSGDTVVIKLDDIGNAFDLSALIPLNILDYDFSVDGIDFDLVNICLDNNDLTVVTDDILDEITITTCAGNLIAGGSDIRFEIGTNATFAGAGTNMIRNPTIGSGYFVDIAGTFADSGRTVIVTTPSSGTSVSATVGGAVTPPGGGGGGGTISQTGNLQMSGKAYPYAFITILKDNEVVGTSLADQNGNFDITIKSIISNRIYDFGIYAQDDFGLFSPTHTYNLGINTNQITEVSNILIPATISISEDKIYQGESLVISGSAYPNSLIVSFISPLFMASTVNSDENGRWIYTFDSTTYEPNEYYVRAKTVFSGGEQSEYSEELKFKIIKKIIPPDPTPGPDPTPDPSDPQKKCNGSNLNDDSRVDILDFSIMLHYWQSKKPANSCADINQNGIVDIYDFSVMMYEWTD